VTAPGHPVVAVVLDPWRGLDIGPLVSALAPYCDVRAFQPNLGATAVLAASWRAPELARARRETPGPFVLWDTADDPAPESLRAGADLVLDASMLGAYSIDVSTVRWMPPLVRARLRHREGLPAGLVVDLDRMGDDVARSAAAVAAAVVVTGPRAALALAVGAPTVTDARTAAELGIGSVTGLGRGAGAEHEVAVLGGMKAAMAVAGDERRAAALSWWGRRFVEEHLDVGRAAAPVIELLGLDRRSGLDRALDELRAAGASLETSAAPGAG